MPPDRLLFRDFCLLTMQGTMDEGLSLIRRGALLTQGERIAWLGPVSDIPVDAKPTQVIDGEGRCLSPGLIDCHTHVIWGGKRIADWEARQRGATYESIARAGGGILSTVTATRETSEESLYATARERLEIHLRQGVTGVEVKSGYGLDLESELKMLRVATDLRDSLPLHISRTLLAAHAVPPEYQGRTDEYVAWVVTEMIPAAQLNCEAVDVFCEAIAFTVSQSVRILEVAKQFGLGLKIHAEQRSLQGGAAAVAAMGGWSADHLEYLDEMGVAALRQFQTVAVLLPGSYYFLKETQRPPVELLRKYKVPIAIATDYNPGSSPLSNLSLAMNMACTFFGLTPAEAWMGVTHHAARALRWETQLGMLRPGMFADLAIWNFDEPAELPYGIGHNPCGGVVHRGEVVFLEQCG